MTAAAARQPAVELTGVSVWYAGTAPVLDRVDLTVRAGEHWALLGANGAGKSTLLALAGAQRFASAGEVSVLGQRLGRVDMRALRRRIGAVDAAARIPPSLTLIAYVATGLTQTVQPASARAPDDATVEAVTAALDRVGLARFAGRIVVTLSAGERARARLARALVGRPELLVLDEPAAGLDLPGRADLLDVLESLPAGDPELASVLVAHHLEELPATTTHVALLRAEAGPGRILTAGPVSLLDDTDLLASCFGRPVSTARIAGRWCAVAAGGVRAGR